MGGISSSSARQPPSSTWLSLIPSPPSLAADVDVGEVMSRVKNAPDIDYGGETISHFKPFRKCCLCVCVCVLTYLCMRDLWGLIILRHEGIALVRAHVKHLNDKDKLLNCITISYFVDHPHSFSVLHICIVIAWNTCVLNFSPN